MHVQDVMTPRPTSVRPTTSIAEARRIMQRQRVRHLPVTDGDRLVGIISDRDIVVRDQLLDTALDRLGSETYWGHERHVAEVMSADVISIAADATLSEAGRLMRQHRVSALPVVRAGRLVGIVTTHDLLGTLPHRSAEEEHAAAAVTRLLPMGPGDVRPGRRPAPPKALVVNADATRRSSLARRLEDEGYEIVTCPGPRAGVFCEACNAHTDRRCARVTPDVDVIMLEQELAGSPLADAYHEWVPAARLQLTADDAVVFRTAPGTKLDAAGRHHGAHPRA